MFTLENNFVKVLVSSSGAELHSVFSKTLNKELLWQADKNVWARHAPVLFPIVGKLKEDTYEYEGRKYSLPQHGFARDREFVLIVQTETSVELELRESAETLIHFPFAFRLHIKYELDENAVKCSYTVDNTGDGKMFFSLGSHPGFMCPLFEDEKLSDYRIEFDQIETAERRILKDGLCSGKHESVFNETGVIQLSQELFEKDALVFDSLKSESLKLVSAKYALNFNWFNMPYFGIWTKKGTGVFVCLEPWAGIADSLSTSGDLKQKEGIIELEKDENYTCGFGFYANKQNEF